MESLSRACLSHTSSAPAFKNRLPSDSHNYGKRGVNLWVSHPKVVGLNFRPGDRTAHFCVQFYSPYIRFMVESFRLPISSR